MYGAKDNSIRREIALLYNYQALNRISDAIAKERKQVKLVEASPEISLEQKRQAQLRFNYITELATGYLYGKPAPVIPSDLNIDENNLNDWMEFFGQPIETRL